MTVCSEATWYRLLVLAFVGVAIGIGTAIMIGALVASDSSTLAHLVVGGWWLSMGCYSLARRRQLVNAMSFDGAVLHLSSPAGSIDLPVLSIRLIGYRWYDYLRMQTLRITTESETVKAVARFDGLRDMLITLRQANPSLVWKI